LHNFTQLIQRMNLTVDEVLYFNQMKANDYTEFFQAVSLAYAKQNIKVLKKHLENENHLYQTTQIKFHKYNMTMIRAIIKDLEPDFLIESDDIDELVDYILKCSFWTTYEISLFGNSLSLFSEELLAILLKEIKKRVLDYQVMRKNFRDLIRLLQNASIIFLRKNKVDQAVAISIFSETVIESDQYFELTRKLFIDGLIDLALGQQEEGERKAMQSIEVMKTFSENFAEQHFLEFEKFQQKY
ncbi:MAG: hypothetical protein L0L39_03145, partial [Atopostipes suicloacalis]|nr:hypothetical protein [Atopostipes suicloacalis]